MKKVLCFGEILVDFLPSDDGANSFTAIAGGAPANVAVAVAKLGGDGCFVGGVSQDNFGDMLASQLQTYHVDTQYLCRIKDKNTAVVLVSLDENKERSFNFYRHDTADMNFSSDDFQQESFCDSVIFHFCSNTLTNQAMTDTTLAGLKMARENGLIVSLDINLRLSLWHDSGDIYQRVLQCLEYTDIIKFSREELEYLAQQSHQAPSALIALCLHQGAQLVVVTDGGNEISTFTANNQFNTSIPPVVVVDTTAAGDAFVGGLLFQLAQRCDSRTTLKRLLNNPECVEEMVFFASRCGASACSKKGAFPALPTLDQCQLLIA